MKTPAWLRFNKYLFYDNYFSADKIKIYFDEMYYCKLILDLLYYIIIPFI